MSPPDNLKEPQTQQNILSLHIKLIVNFNIIGFIVLLVDT